MGKLVAEGKSATTPEAARGPTSRGRLFGCGSGASADAFAHVGRGARLDQRRAQEVPATAWGV
jgi:hypothetical protein